MNTHTSTKPLFAIVITSALFALAGCSVIPEPKADATRFYVLSAPTEAGAVPAAIPEQSSKNKPTLAVRIELPAYLASVKSIAVRQGRNEIVYHDFARWAEPLDAGIARIIRERLLASGAAKSVVLPLERGARDFDVIIRVKECEGENSSDGLRASFAAEYELTAPGSEGVLVRKFFKAPATAWHDKNYSEFAEKIGVAVSALADDIAAQIPAHEISK